MEKREPRLEFAGMKVHVIFLSALFVLGLGAGWMMRPVTKSADGQSPRPTGAGGARGAPRGIEPLGSHAEVVHKATPDVITQITSRSGYFGYSESDREKLISALVTWYMDSPGDALAWVKVASPYPKLVSQLFGELVIGIATSDFHEGLELAKSEIGILSGAGGDPVSALFRLSVSHGAEAVLQVAELGVGGENRRFFPYCEFPDGFDFQTTLNGLADLNATLGEGRRFNVLPGNLLGEWAKLDPAAAWSWLQEGREIGRNDTELDYFRGYRDLVDDYELGETVGAYMGFDGEGIQGLMGLLSRQTISAEIVEGYVLAADPAERIGVVADLIRQSGNFANEWGDQLRTTMLSNLEPATRLSALELALGDLDSSEREGMRPILLEMGHTEDELDHLYQVIRK